MIGKKFRIRAPTVHGAPRHVWPPKHELEQREPYVIHRNQWHTFEEPPHIVTKIPHPPISCAITRAE